MSAENPDQKVYVYALFSSLNYMLGPAKTYKMGLS